MKTRLVLIVLFLCCKASMAQLCQNSTDTVYGLTAVGTMGQIVGINVNNAGTTVIGTPAASASSSNAMGFCQVDGRYYFFNQVGAGTIEFISYDPITSSKVTLANPALLPTTQRIRSGVVTRTGFGYYMIYPAATTAQGYPQNGPALYYYNIALNTWTLITQNFRNSSGTNIANIVTLNSGDMAFDGNDNLWMLCSNTTSHALYKIAAPLPTTAVASVLVDTIIAQRANPISGVSFTGIAFNLTGTMFLTTGSGAGAGNNILYSLASITAPFVTVGTVPNSYGDDLTSCVYPTGVLSVRRFNYSVTEDNGNVRHEWLVDENLIGVFKYSIEQSNDGISFHHLADIAPTGAGPGQKSYSFLSSKPPGDIIFYRVVMTGNDNSVRYSPIQRIKGQPTADITIGPNPASNYIIITNKTTLSGYTAHVYSLNGILIKSILLTGASQTVDIGQLTPGVYYLIISGYPGSLKSKTYKIVKQL